MDYQVRMGHGNRSWLMKVRDWTGKVINPGVVVANTDNGSIPPVIVEEFETDTDGTVIMVRINGLDITGEGCTVAGVLDVPVTHDLKVSNCEIVQRTVETTDALGRMITVGDVVDYGAGRKGTVMDMIRRSGGQELVYVQCPVDEDDEEVWLDQHYGRCTWFTGDCLNITGGVSSVDLTGVKVGDVVVEPRGGYNPVVVVCQVDSVSVGDSSCEVDATVLVCAGVDDGEWDNSRRDHPGDTVRMSSALTIGSRPVNVLSPDFLDTMKDGAVVFGEALGVDPTPEWKTTLRSVRGRGVQSRRDRRKVVRKAG